jgi:hypothetical protein
MWKPPAPIPHRDKIIELGICLFEYDRQSGRIYRVLGITDERSPVIVLTIALSMIC